VLIVPVGGVALFVANRRRRRTSTVSDLPDTPDASAGAQASTEQLQRDAAAALVDLDDAIRSSGEEALTSEPGSSISRPRPRRPRTPPPARAATN
jgi:hypothetical protein